MEEAQIITEERNRFESDIDKDGKYLKISSKGVIEENAFRLIGASTKREDDSKIGFFGSGLKYAIAFLMRQEIELKIFAGEQEIKLTTEDTLLRDTSFKVILVNGVETSLTTELGAKWGYWGSLRELVCNAIDEGEEKIEVVDDAIAVEDYTSFYIKVNDDIRKILNDWGLYFSEARNDLKYAFDRVAELEDFLQDEVKFKNRLYNGGKGLVIYRKGIQCYLDTETKSLFHYDMDFAEINESRVLDSMHVFKYQLVKYLKQYASQELVKNILKNMQGHWEGTLDWDDAYFIDFNENWKEAAKEELLVPEEVAGMHARNGVDLSEAIQVPNALAKNLKKQFGSAIQAAGYTDDSDEEMIVVDRTSKQDYLLQEVMNFFEEVGYAVDYPVKIVQFESKKRLGQAKDNTILISEKVFDLGRKEIANTIIEENEHLKSGHGDETRAFQTHLIGTMLTYMEEKNGFFL